MADTTITAAALLCSAQGHGAGQIQWWQFTFDLVDAQTTISIDDFKEEGPGGGMMIGIIDAGGVDSGKGGISIDGAGTTGLTLMTESDQEIKFFNTQDGANAATSEALDDLQVVIVFAV